MIRSRFRGICLSLSGVLCITLSACGSPGQGNEADSDRVNPGLERNSDDLRSVALQSAPTWPTSPESERDGIYSLLAYATVLKDFQTEEGGFDRGHNIGSILVDDNTDEIVFWARNAVFVTGNPTQHAEMRTISCYLSRVGPSSLEDFTLYTSLEPCAMCAGMMFQTQLTRTVYGQSDPGFGDAIDRLSLDSTDLPGGYPPYPRQTRAEASPEFHRYWLDLAYTRYRESERYPRLTEFLRTPAAQEIFEDAWTTLRTYQARYPENERVVNGARAYFEVIHDGYARSCSVPQ